MKETGTADTLVTVARGIFAQHGYDGASVRSITGEAGANLGAITYHFGSKRDLYDRVLASVLVPLAERLEAVVHGAGGVLERAGAVVRAYFEYVAENPDLPQLMLQELVQMPAPSAVVAAPLKRVHGALTALVEEGQRAGVVRPGPSRALGIFILSAPVHLVLLQRALRHHLVLDLAEPGLRQEVVASAVEFVTAGLSLPVAPVEDR
jgi:AcrR family transcriptional regulator